MKEKILILIITIMILLAGCSTTNKLVITTKEDQNIDVLLNGKYKGTIDKNNEIELTIMSFDECEVIAKNSNSEEKDEFYGFIKYCVMKDNNVGILQEINAKEIRKEESIRNNTSIRYISFYRGTEEKDNSKVGYLKLTSNQDIVDIYIDGKQAGQITGGKPFIKKIQIGEHVVMAKKEFFMPYTISAKISNNDIFQFHFELKNVKGWIEEEPEMSTIQQARGNMTIVTERNDYIVYIEGYEKIPPFELKNMPAGKYSIKIIRPGFEEIIYISVNDGEDKFIDLDLMFE